LLLLPLFLTMPILPLRLVLLFSVVASSAAAAADAVYFAVAVTAAHLTLSNLLLLLSTRAFAPAAFFCRRYC
jgi:hypothetical protein